MNTNLRRAVDLGAGAVLIGVLLAVLIVSCGAAHAQTLGDKLAAKGYTRTLFVAQPNAPGTFACQWGRCITGDFAPGVPYTQTALSAQARWGVDQSSSIVKGNTVGERLGDLTCAAKTLGLPAGYVITSQDLGDARVVTKPGQQTAAWDAELSAMTCGDNPPPPAGCEPPKVCALPCPACPMCPPPPPCPPAPPACAPMPATVRAAIGKMQEWSVVGPARRRAYAAVQAWAATCPAVP